MEILLQVLQSESQLEVTSHMAAYPILGTFII